jgi:Streptomycin adenylyltransferase
MTLPDTHRRFLDTVLTQVRHDHRFVGLAAGGSLLTSEVDEFSDLDLVPVVDPEHHTSVMAQRLDITASWGRQLAAFTGEHVGEPRVVICLYEDPLLHVDFKFVTPQELATRIEDPLVLWERATDLTDAIGATESRHPMPDLAWIEDRFWVWVHYAATKIGRGEVFEVLEFLSFLRSQVLGPLALVSAGHLPRGVRRLETYVPAFAEQLQATVATYSLKECGDAVRSCVRLYRELREELAPVDLVRRTAAEQASVAYLEAVSR